MKLVSSYLEFGKNYELIKKCITQRKKLVLSVKKHTSTQKTTTDHAANIQALIVVKCDGAVVKRIQMLLAVV